MPIQNPTSLPDWVPQEYMNPIMAAASQYQVDPLALAAIAKQESGFNPGAIGPMTKYGKAQGMFQFLPSTAKSYGIDPLDPTQAANATAKMLAENLRKFGTLEQAIMAHHGGPNTKIWGPKTRAYGDSVMGIMGNNQSIANPTQPDVDPALLAILFEEML